MAGKPPYFPFYPRDFASDGKVEAMTTEEVGAYILLLCKAWLEEPSGTLPADDRVLARWSRLDLNRWLEVKPSVLSAFHVGPDGRWHQKRMKEEFENFRKVSRLRTQSARSRWDKRKTGREEPPAEEFHPTTDPPDGDANAMQKHSKCNANGVQNGYGAYASGSVSESPSGDLVEEGFVERAGSAPQSAEEKPFDFTAEGLAQQFRFHQKGRKEPLDELTGCFEEAIKLGQSPKRLFVLITDNRRDRSERYWQFKKREIENGQSGNRERVRSPSRVSTPAESWEAINRKTIAGAAKVNGDALGQQAANGAHKPGDRHDS